MKRLLIMSLVVLAASAYAGAAVIDDYEGGTGWASNYTVSSSSGTPTIISSTTGGAAGEAPFAGSELGVPSGGSQLKNNFMWNGPEQTSSGDSLGLMVYTDSGGYGGLGIVVKMLGGTEAYLATLTTYGGTVGMNVGTTDLMVSPGGTPIATWGEAANKWLGATQNHTANAGQTTVGTADVWYRLDVTYTEVAATSNTVDFYVYDAGGSEVGHLTYVDTGSAGLSNQGTGDFGFSTQPWTKINDVDNLTYVPEPASMAVLGVGGLLMLIRRRRR